MATVMLIPAIDPLAGTDFFTGVVLECIPSKHIDDRVIWRSPVARVSKLDAEADAIEALERIAYERRHQLALWQERGIPDDSELPGMWSASDLVGGQADTQDWVTQERVEAHL